MLGAVVGIVGLELGCLPYQARRRTGRFELSGVLPYRPGRFTWRKVLLVVGLWIWGLGDSVQRIQILPISFREGVQVPLRCLDLVVAHPVQHRPEVRASRGPADEDTPSG